MKARNDAVIELRVRTLRFVFDKPDELRASSPEAVIAVLATALDHALEVYLEASPERGAVVHAHVLAGLANPGVEKMSTR